MPPLDSAVSQAALEVLNYERYHYPHPLVQKRLHAVYMCNTLNLTYKVIGHLVDLTPRSVSRWHRVYSKEGIEALKVVNYGTNKSELEAHREVILLDFERDPPRSSPEAADRIFELTGVKRSEQQVRVFLKKAGLRFLKCGHLPAKADPVAQRTWVEQKLNPAIEAAKEGHIHLLFSDAAHFVLQPFLCFLWSAVRVFLKGSSGRNRINVLGAVNAITKEVTTLINDTYVTADTLLHFLNTLRHKYGDGKTIAIVLDNARYQHCAVVKAAALSLNIELLFLPPYSPNLNIIERLWKFTKKQILYAKYYDKPKEFHKAIKDFFQTINQKHTEKLNALLTLNFQFFDS